MTRADYETDICRRWNGAAKIPFKSVFFNGWKPSESNCHNNVDAWVCANERLGWTAVRGWINDPSFDGIRLTGHSVVRGPDGQLFDITPFSDERLRDTTLFISHLGDDRSFFVMKEMGHYIYCPKSGSL